MSAVIANLVAYLSAHTGQFEDGLKKAGGKAKEFGRNVERSVGGAGGRGGMGTFLEKLGKHEIGGFGVSMLKYGGIAGALALAGKAAYDFGENIIKAREEAAKLGQVFNSGLTAPAELGLIRFAENVDTAKNVTLGFISELLGKGLDFFGGASQLKPEQELAQSNATMKSAFHRKAFESVYQGLSAEKLMARLEGVDKAMEKIKFEFLIKGFGELAKGEEMTLRRNLKAIEMDKEAQAAAERLTGQIEAMKDRLRDTSPITQFADQIELLFQGLAAGEISQGEYEGMAKGLRKQTALEMAKDIREPDLNWGGKVQGSSAAYETIVAHEMNTGRDDQLRVLEEQLKKEEEMANFLGYIADTISGKAIMVDFN